MPALIFPLYSQATGSYWNWGPEGPAPTKQQGTHISNHPSWQILFVKHKCWGGENCMLGFPWTCRWKLASPTEVLWNSCNFPREGEKLSVVFSCIPWITREVNGVLNKTWVPNPGGGGDSEMWVEYAWAAKLKFQLCPSLPTGLEKVSYLTLLSFSFLISERDNKTCPAASRAVVIMTWDKW